MILNRIKEDNLIIIEMGSQVLHQQQAKISSLQIKMISGQEIRVNLYLVQIQQCSSSLRNLITASNS